MPRVSKDTLEKLKAFVDSLPMEAMGKCALCVDTLTHLEKTAGVKTGAPTATITRAFADRINENAAPWDRVSGEKLRDRVRKQDPVIREKFPNKSHPEPDQPDKKEEKSPVVENTATEQIKNWRENKSHPENDYVDCDLDSLPMRYARMAVLDLEKIENSHPDRNKAFNYVIEWIKHAKGV
jgi:hypothetical protein